MIVQSHKFAIQLNEDPKRFPNDPNMDGMNRHGSLTHLYPK